jgi:hypothetical protein
VTRFIGPPTVGWWRGRAYFLRPVAFVQAKHATTIAA